jgi:hypothetical protein
MVSFGKIQFGVKGSPLRRILLRAAKNTHFEAEVNPQSD